MVFIPTETNHWVDESFERLARMVKDYDEFLELRWIPPERRTREDRKPYIIYDIIRNVEVLYASELDNPQEILTRLYMADTTRNDVLGLLEANEQANQAYNMQRQADQYEEAADQAKFMINTRLHTFKMNGKKFDGHTLRVKE